MIDDGKESQFQKCLLLRCEWFFYISFYNVKAKSIRIAILFLNLILKV